MPQNSLTSAHATVDAGSFGSWLSQFRASLRGQAGTDVPCGECVGCCVSSYSILVRPEDTPALTAIPSEWLTDVPSLGAGIKAMGYLPDGHCPMLRAGKCSIYMQRPQTCRDYDCRVFAAAGIEAGLDKTVINTRVREWRFTYATEAERAAHRAIQQAAAFIREHQERFPDKRFPKNPSGIAVLAVKCYQVFLNPKHEQQEHAVLAASIVEASRDFDNNRCGR